MKIIPSTRTSRNPLANAWFFPARPGVTENGGRFGLGRGGGPHAPTRVPGCARCPAAGFTVCSALGCGAGAARRFKPGSPCLRNQTQKSKSADNRGGMSADAFSGGCAIWGESAFANWGDFAPADTFKIPGNSHLHIPRSRSFCRFPEKSAEPSILFVAKTATTCRFPVVAVFAKDFVPDLSKGRLSAAVAGCIHFRFRLGGFAHSAKMISSPSCLPPLPRGSKRSLLVT